VHEKGSSGSLFRLKVLLNKGASKDELLEELHRVLSSSFCDHLHLEVHS